MRLSTKSAYLYANDAKTTNGTNWKARSSAKVQSPSRSLCSTSFAAVSCNTSFSMSTKEVAEPMNVAAIQAPMYSLVFFQKVRRQMMGRKMSMKTRLKRKGVLRPSPDRKAWLSSASVAGRMPLASSTVADTCAGAAATCSGEASRMAAPDSTVAAAWASSFCSNGAAAWVYPAPKLHSSAFMKRASDRTWSNSFLNSNDKTCVWYCWTDRLCAAET
mmetsp:Transcript_42597/g.135323  ORF Transcript_42597/g.135323 Transcript_42597/m.135323 type:complete len:217 (-) Transcript_42597:1335-1985(-)